MEIINLTPHALTFVGESSLVVKPSGQVARVACRTVQVGSVSCGGIDIPLTATEYGEVEGLPEPSENTIYIVSLLVAQRCRERRDVFIPNESVRDEQGRIVGCRSIGRV